MRDFIRLFFGDLRSRPTELVLELVVVVLVVLIVVVAAGQVLDRLAASYA